MASQKRTKKAQDELGAERMNEGKNYFLLVDRYFQNGSAKVITLTVLAYLITAYLRSAFYRGWISTYC